TKPMVVWGLLANGKGEKAVGTAFPNKPGTSFDAVVRKASPARRSSFSRTNPAAAADRRVPAPAPVVDRGRGAGRRRVGSHDPAGRPHTTGPRFSPGGRGANSG